jgi:hypothetical protein
MCINTYSLIERVCVEATSYTLSACNAMKHLRKRLCCKDMLDRNAERNSGEETNR